jgi:predicted CXXCH cytochrome family protein
LLAVAFAGFLLLLAPPSFAANHPPIAGKNADCSSCHADMLTGKSVHSQGEISCMLCHSAEPSDGTVKVTMTLALSGEKLCFACHERTAMQKHYPESQRDCLGCHDAHRSARAMLLRRDVDLPYAPEPASSTANAKGERLPPRSP